MVLACIAPSLDEAGIGYPPIQEDRALRWILDVMARGFVLVAIADGRVIGSAGFDAFQFPWNGDLWCFNNTWLYVQPEYRKGGTTAMLIRHAVKYAEARQAPIIMGNTSGYRAELKDMLIGRAGFTYAGGFFVRGLEKVGEGSDEQPIRGRE
jgi:GNAT superfamily N-acetyltransferase